MPKEPLNSNGDVEKKLGHRQRHLTRKPCCTVSSSRRKRRSEEEKGPGREQERRDSEEQLSWQVQTMGPSEEADCRSSVESPSEKEVRKGHFMAVGSSERLADQFLLLGLPLESEVCKNIPTI